MLVFRTPYSSLCAHVHNSTIGCVRACVRACSVLVRVRLHVMAAGVSCSVQRHVTDTCRRRVQRRAANRSLSRHESAPAPPCLLSPTPPLVHFPSSLPLAAAPPHSSLGRTGLPDSAAKAQAVPCWDHMDSGVLPSRACSTILPESRLTSHTPSIITRANNNDGNTKQHPQQQQPPAPKTPSVLCSQALLLNCYHQQRDKYWWRFLRDLRNRRVCVSRWTPVDCWQGPKGTWDAGGVPGCVCSAFLSVLEKVGGSQELNVANQQVETTKCVWRRWRRLTAYQSTCLLKLGPFISTPLSWRSSSTSCTLGSFLSDPLDSHRAALCCKNTKTVRQEHREVV